MRQTIGMLLLIGVLLTSCYRMPGEDDYSVIPATNNPNVCKDRGPSQWMPGAQF